MSPGVELYHKLMDETEKEMESLPRPVDNPTRQKYLEKVFAAFPDDWDVLRRQGLAYFRLADEEEQHHQQQPPVAESTESETKSQTSSTTTSFEGQDGRVYEPITYEDFLPASAAGIFQSNLGAQQLSVLQAGPDQKSFEKALGRKVLDSHWLYLRESAGVPVPESSEE